MKYTKEQTEKGQELMQILIAKAWDDATFKEQLINDPKATITEFLDGNFNLPEGKKIVVRDQSNADTVYINIPRKVAIDDIELNEEQLDLVSGGGWLGAAIGATIGAVGGPLGVAVGAYVGHMIEENL